MLQKTADKFQNIKDTGTPLSRIRTAKAESDFIIGNSENAPVAKRHSENIRGQIFQSSGSVTDWFAMYDLFIAPDISGYAVKPIGLLEGIAEFGAEYPR